jgi:hypothetical protein
MTYIRYSHPDSREVGAVGNPCSSGGDASFEAPSPQGGASRQGMDQTWLRSRILEEQDHSPSLCNREDRLHFRPGTWFTLFESGHSGPTYESIA